MTAASLTIAALDRVKAKHPFAASGEVTPTLATDARASELWRALLAMDGERLRNHVRSLSSSNIRLAVYGATPILADDGVLERVATVLELRGDLYHRRSPVAWHGFLLSDGDARFRECSRAFLETRPDVGYWHALVEVSRPLAALQQDYVVSNSVFDAWWASPRIDLGRHSAIERSLFRSLLVNETADALLSRETPTTIDRWLSVALSEEDRIAWHLRYVARSNASRWLPTDPFLERILTRYRTPVDGHSFWNEVSEPRQRDFVRWLRDRELTSLLGEGERVEFWRRFLTHVERSTESADGAAVFIIFRRWFAVQFKEMGKATYMFPRDHLIVTRRLGGSQLYRYVLDHAPLGRYAHQGGYWQYNAQREVGRILESTQRE